MDTLGNLLDKQLTVTMKLRHCDTSSKAINLSQQLGSLTKEIDSISKKILSGEIKPEDSIRPQHKTY